MSGIRLSVATLLVSLLLTAGLPAQLRVHPVAELPGNASLELELRKLHSSATFMETTAHPDDEDSGLLAMLGHGEGMRVVLVSATRGNGGQNEIGPELFEPLGVLRTEELLAVHRFDGAEQYFTRAIDFGYSFSIEESIEKWGHDEIVGDFVRHIRTVRPDVVAGFLCSGQGGGLHHQASALLTNEAFRAAGDPGKYPGQIKEGLRPFQAARLFCTAPVFGPQAQAPLAPDMLRVDVSGFDPVLGRTYAELGTEARSMHKCQGTSQLLLLPGQGQNRVYRLRDAVTDQTGAYQPGTAPAGGVRAPKTMFEGIDTSLPGLARFAGAKKPAALVTALQEIDAAVRDADRALRTSGSAAAVAPLAAGLRLTRALRAKLATLLTDAAATYEIDFRLAQKERQFQDALVLASELRVEVLANDGVVTVGQPLRVSITAANRGPADVALAGVTLAGVQGAAPACAPAIKAGAAINCSADVRVAEAPLSTPYWTPRQDSARYDFEPGVPFGVPFRPTPFRATVRLNITGADITLEHPVEFRYDNVTAGEKRMELEIVPAFNVRVAPDIAVSPLGAAAPREIALTIGNNAKGAATATAALQAPAGWNVTPPAAPVSFSREDEEITVKFTVAPPRGVKAGDYPVAAKVDGVAADGTKLTSTTGYQVIEYPHIHRRHVVAPAHTHVKVIDVTLPAGLHVGYVMGVGDQVPQAIQQLGASVQMITADELASGDLSKYDVIVTGVRAYERRPDLRANNHRLLAYAENGGTVLVQYNKFEFNEAQYGPYPARVSSNRVTDENAPVEILAPEDPVFNRPNRIGPSAWTGWVQERGLYFLGDRDPRYRDLVRLADPFPLNAGPKTGALVEAQVGKGRWVYIGLGLWRQLPAGTPGAYQLMANLLSLGARK